MYSEANWVLGIGYRIYFMTCEIENRERLIDDYIAGALSEEEMEFFDEHCFGCDTCFHELRLREEMAGLIKKEGKVLFADYLEQRETKKRGIFQSVLDKLPFFAWTSQPGWIYATAGVAVVILCVVLYRGAFMPGNVDRISDPFAASSYLEEMIDDVSRSYSLVVHMPQPGDTMAGDPFFQWDKIEAKPIQLKILNNRGEELFTVTPERNRYIHRQKLNPGLYYWKLESEEDLLFVGKFFVVAKPGGKE